MNKRINTGSSDRKTIVDLVKKGFEPKAVNDMYNQFSRMYVSKHQEELIDMYTQNAYNTFLKDKNEVLKRYSSRWMDTYQIAFQLRD